MGVIGTRSDDAACVARSPRLYRFCTALPQDPHRMGMETGKPHAGAGGNTKKHHIPKLQAIPGVHVEAVAKLTRQ